MARENETGTNNDGAGEVRQDRLWFLDGMDRINSALQGTDDFEQMGDVLNAVLSIFRCDRAWIVSPCDPESRTWRTVAERAAPKFAESGSLGLDLPMDAEVAHVHRVVAASKTAKRFGPEGNNPIPSGMAERFGVQSQLCVAIYPKIDKPYIFGLDQCTWPRNWTKQEQNLFEAMGQRLATLLTSLLMSRDLQESKARLEEAQRVAHVGHWEWDLETNVIVWSDESYRIFGLKPQERPMDLATVRALVHPDDRESLYRGVDEDLVAGVRPEDEFRIVLPSGEVRTLHALTSIRWNSVPGDSKRDASGRPYKLLGTVQDVTERVQLMEELRRHEAYLTEAQRLSHTGSFGWKPRDGEIVWSDETYRIFEYDPSRAPTLEMVLQRVHADDAAIAHRIIERASTGTDFDEEFRLSVPSGAIKHIHVRARSHCDDSGNVEFIGAVTDITHRKTAEEKVRQQEAELRQVLDLAPQLVAVYGPNSERLYANRNALEYLGVSLDEWLQTPNGADVHPDDVEKLWAFEDRGSSSYDLEVRVRKGDGSFRWFLIRFSALRDEKGQLMRWYVACTDIDERKRAEEKLQQENVALREEIDKASMFEEIVGTSRPLKAVLSRIAKVGPTDSTVLITGETGTGKELIARAVHKRSRRSGRVFISVNCAATPRDLVLSELFGHEKGAFTGATQRRLGRFELADGGTIFLDEVGELLPDTQAALLRVLQEREFERLGGERPVQVDVRVIAATNRDLNAAVANGTFRQDLLYRLNVFPIEIPPLRERKDDILMLVEYFVQRYANRAGRNIRSIDQKTLDLLQSYDWPGNIRELQNVIERSIILSSTDVFSVDELWLSKGTSPQASRAETASALNVEPRTEREIIEAALAETRGRVSGPSGAAAKLRIPPSTLETRIKALKINKQQFKFG
jgi:formate hydrogenlyase transcriptional activator